MTCATPTLPRNWNCPPSRRRGIATLWLVMVLPLMLLLIGLAVDGGNLWFERAKLENSLEAAALAAVKEWPSPYEAAGRPSAIDAGLAFAAANTVAGKSAALGPDGSNFFVFGRVRPVGQELVFSINDYDNTDGRKPAVHVMAEFNIASHWGMPGGYSVLARTTAILDVDGPRLVRVDAFEPGGLTPPASPPAVTQGP